MLHTISLLLQMSAIVQASSRTHTAGCTGLCSMVPEISRTGVREIVPPNKSVARDNYDLNHYLTMLGFSSILGFWVAQFFMTQIYSQSWKAFSPVLSPNHTEMRYLFAFEYCCVGWFSLTHALLQIFFCDSHPEHPVTRIFLFHTFKIWSLSFNLKS